MSDISNIDIKPSLSILVVDDDELNQRMMRLILERDGHVVDCASNGLEAVDAVKSHPYNIVLMDLQMPVMDGVEASRRIRQWESEGAHIFIVALTASYLPERGEELFEAGIDNYMPKPFEVGHLRNILQYGIEKHKLRGIPVVENAEIDNPPANKKLDFQMGIQRIGGDIETYKELLQDFINELPVKLENIRSCHTIADKDALYRAAHNLKGVSANLGALQLSEHARKLEKQVGEGYTETITDTINEIFDEASKLKDDASNFFAN